MKKYNKLSIKKILAVVFTSLLKLESSKIQFIP